MTDPENLHQRLARETLENSRDLVFWVRPDGSFLWVNPTVCKTLGYTEAELEKMRASDILADYTPDERQELRREINSDGTLAVRATLVRKDGSTFPVESRNQIVTIDGVKYNCANCHDISTDLRRESSLLDNLDKLTEENRRLKTDFRIADSLQIVGTSRGLRHALRTAEQAAFLSSPVLIGGETGVGKESLARYVHAHGKRRATPLVTFNCSTLTENDLISQLFGHARGAYTGAVRERKGLFAEADMGTLFLDEIGELPPVAQAKLLRVLQEGTYYRMGEDKPRSVDVRLVCATNRDLAEMVTEGTFREDLYYRVAVNLVDLPPLRRRKSDIPQLVNFQLARLNESYGRNLARPNRAELDLLKQHSFPGNIRELFNVLERAYASARHGRLEITPGHFGPTLRRAEVSPNMTFREIEIWTIRQALDRCHGKVSGGGGAAELLDLNVSTLKGKMRRLGIGRNNDR